jgi:NAD(P)-dependent dehydrogenase (short-subunit alcohol dehydrogenase family)
MERMGSPKEIADGVLYLVGARSSFVTGAPLFVDGGIRRGDLEDIHPVVVYMSHQRSGLVQYMFLAA